MSALNLAEKISFKDGDDHKCSISLLTIEVVSNGYIAIWTNDDEEDIKEVYKSKDELLKELKYYL